MQAALRQQMVSTVHACSEEEHRWPTCLTLRIKTNGEQGRNWNRTARFPPRPQAPPQPATAESDVPAGNPHAAELGAEYQPVQEQMAAAVKALVQVCAACDGKFCDEMPAFLVAAAQYFTSAALHKALFACAPTAPWSAIHICAMAIVSRVAQPRAGCNCQRRKCAAHASRASACRRQQV